MMIIKRIWILWWIYPNGIAEGGEGVAEEGAEMNKEGTIEVIGVAVAKVEVIMVEGGATTINIVTTTMMMKMIIQSTMVMLPIAIIIQGGHLELSVMTTTMPTTDPELQILLCLPHLHPHLHHHNHH